MEPVAVEEMQDLALLLVGPYQAVAGAQAPGSAVGGVHCARRAGLLAGGRGGGRRRVRRRVGGQDGSEADGTVGPAVGVDQLPPQDQAAVLVDIEPLLASGSR